MQSLDFLKSPVGRVLFFKSLPIFLGIFASFTYNLVDTFFIGQLGTKELAAMSFCFPVVMILINMIHGISTAASSLISKAIGGQDIEGAQKFSQKSIEITLFLSFAVTVGGLFSIEPLFRLLGVDQYLMPLVSEYMGIWYLGVVFLNFSLLGSSIFRARGVVFLPNLVLLLGGLLNCILDPLLIFGWGPFPKLGIQGAAWTTVFGNAFSAIWIFIRLHKKQKIFHQWTLSPKSFSTYRPILFIALPTALASTLVPISTAVTNLMLSSYGYAAVAANSIVVRVETIPFIAIFALGAVIVPFIGQNWGAGFLDRMQNGIKKAFAFSYILGIASAAFILWYKEQIGAFFDPDPQVTHITSLYFSLIPYTYGILGTVFLTVQAMNALNRPLSGNFLSGFRLILLYLPLAFLFEIPYGILGIFQSRLIANLSTGLIATYLIWRTLFKNTATLNLGKENKTGVDNEALLSKKSAKLSSEEESSPEF